MPSPIGAKARRSGIAAVWQATGNEHHRPKRGRRTSSRCRVLHCRCVRFRRFAVAAILAITVAGPIVEIFDDWDHTLQDGNDTEANVVIAALCIGVALAIGTIVIVARIRFLSSRSFILTLVRQAVSTPTSGFVSPIPTGSPPTLLRV